LDTSIIENMGNIANNVRKADKNRLESRPERGLLTGIKVYKILVENFRETSPENRVEFTPDLSSEPQCPYQLVQKTKRDSSDFIILFHQVSFHSSGQWAIP